PRRLARASTRRRLLRFLRALLLRGARGRLLRRRLLRCRLGRGGFLGGRFGLRADSLSHHLLRPRRARGFCPRRPRGTIPVHRLEVLLPPTLLVFGGLAFGDFAVQERYPGPILERLKPDLQQRVSSFQREFGRSPTLDDSPPRLQLDRRALGVAVKDAKASS